MRLKACRIVLKGQERDTYLLKASLGSNFYFVIDSKKLEIFVKSFIMLTFCKRNLKGNTICNFLHFYSIFKNILNRNC